MSCTNLRLSATYLNIISLPFTTSQRLFETWWKVWWDVSWPPVLNSINTTTLQLESDNKIYILQRQASHLSLDLIPDLPVGIISSVSLLIIIVLQGALQRFLDLIIQVARVCDDGSHQHSHEQGEDDGEVGAEHALALLPGSTTPEEWDDDDEDRDGDQDPDSRGVEGNSGLDI